MKPIMILGVVLILAGVGGLVFRSVHWTETKNVVDAGPIQINHEEDHSVWIPTRRRDHRRGGGASGWCSRGVARRAARPRQIRPADGFERHARRAWARAPERKNA